MTDEQVNALKMLIDMQEQRIGELEDALMAIINRTQHKLTPTEEEVHYLARVALIGEKINGLG